MHNMTGAVVTGSFVMAAVGAFYLLEGRNAMSYGAHLSQGGRDRRRHLRRSPSSFPPATCTASTWRDNQPAAMAAMEGLFKTETGAGMVLMGQPNEETGADRQSHRRQQRAELPHLRHHQGRSEGPRSDSARPVAHGAAAALLRLPHHGRPRNVVRAAHGRRRLPALARQALHARAGCCGRCCSAFRCPTSPTPPAG